MINFDMALQTSICFVNFVTLTARMSRFVLTLDRFFTHNAGATKVIFVNVINKKPSGSENSITMLARITGRSVLGTFGFLNHIAVVNLFDVICKIKF